MKTCEMHVFRRLDAQVRQIQVGLVILEGAHQLVHIVVAMLLFVAVLIYVLTLVWHLRIRVTLLRRRRPLHRRWRTHHLYLFGHR